MISPNAYERNPVWVPVTDEQIDALMGSTEKERTERRASWAKLWGAPKTDKRKGMK